MNNIRRIWFYSVTLVTLGIFAAGVEQLLTLLFNITIKGRYLTLTGATSFNQQQLSLGLAMLVIGGIMWILFWRSIQHHVDGDQEEIGAVIRKLFLNLILLVTALIAVTSAAHLLIWLLAGPTFAEFSSSGLAIIIVTSIVWFYHWGVSESEGHPSSAAKTLRRWYTYVLTSFGLVWLTVGLVQIINVTFVNLPIWGNTLVRGQFWNNTAETSVAHIVLGSAIWYFHWFYMAKDDFDSTLRQVYFYLLTISGSAIAVLVSSAILLFRFFSWIFDGTSTSNSSYFQFLGWAVPTILVGLVIWGYHRRLALEEAGRLREKRESSQRVYLYLMAFLGLGTLVAGLITLFGIFVSLIINTAGTSLTITIGWWRNQLSLCLALLLVGAPLWLYYWNRILKRSQTGGIAEWRALSRRIFLYVVIGVSIITLAVDLVNIVYQSLSGVFKGDFGINILRDSKWSLQTMIIAVPLLWYYWQILRTDQRRGAESGVTRRNVTLLVDASSGDLPPRLESKLGFKIHLLRRVGQTTEEFTSLPDEEIDRLVNEIHASPSNKVMLVVLGGKVTVLPYQDSTLEKY